MSIKLFGVDWQILTIVILILSIVVPTEIFKNKGFLKRLSPLIQSWIFAAIVYIPLAVFKSEVVNFEGILQYLFFILMINGGYKIFKKLMKRLAKLKSLI